MYHAIIDDFGQELRLFDISIDAMNQYIRFKYDGEWEGIAEEIISGKTDDDSMRFFGLIA